MADEGDAESLAARALNAIAQGGGEAWTLGAVGPLSSREELDSDDIRSLIRETIEQTGGARKAVIVAHAASHAIGHGDVGSCASSSRPRRRHAQPASPKLKDSIRPGLLVPSRNRMPAGPTT